MRIPPNLRELFPFPVETIKQLAQMVAQPQLVTALKEAAEKVGIKEPFGPGGVQQILQQAGRWVDAVAEGFTGRSGSQTGVAGVNATGELFSHRWTNLPTTLVNSQAWLELMACYSDSEALYAQLKSLILKLTGAEDVLILSNTTAALHGLAAANRDAIWVVPRVDCIKIPRFGVAGPSSIRDTLEFAGVEVREVGSNQECHREDIQFAISPSSTSPSSTGLSPTGPSSTGPSPTALFVTSPDSLPSEYRELHLKNATEIASQSGALLVRLLFNAHLRNVAGLSLSTSIVSEQWTSANDVLLVPCDGFLGGTEACLVLVQKKLPFWQSLQRIVQVAGLEASSQEQAFLLRSFRMFESVDQWEKTLLGQCLTNNVENLKNRADRLAIQIAGTGKVEKAVVVSKPCRMGTGVWMNEKLESSVLQLFPRSSSVGSLRDYLESTDRPIWSNAYADHVELVLRTMDPDDDRYVAQRLSDEPIDSEARTDSES
jgi:seryl-tRNA(Sec) selenium transferase